ncbi:hypothetical protein CWATWH0402_2870 [Crocosphaera watsonii WH 0402]|uniref:Uncharacterized protein n=3 Tax=Crocosphaera watsonii TaxID=263511 RepID=T2JL21_CROWT|nr:hypothetical protein CWATWH0003_4369 [Crocosphaera watsonii WH 0003]CCQ56748.1 hypothetical protein CWATWH0005_2563 [Crocosphaera watsonii WH 0005]CCQ65754.1 hypothetical protein CWATWH0402_2870 [Crocosphaera watsonii WH 0402]
MDEKIEEFKNTFCIYCYTFFEKMSGLHKNLTEDDPVFRGLIVDTRNGQLS